MGKNEVGKMSQVIFVLGKKILVLHSVGQDFTLRGDSNSLVDFLANLSSASHFLFCKMVFDMAILVLKYDLYDSKNQNV